MSTDSSRHDSPLWDSPGCCWHCMRWKRVSYGIRGRVKSGKEMRTISKSGDFQMVFAEKNDSPDVIWNSSLLIPTPLSRYRQGLRTVFHSCTLSVSSVTWRRSHILALCAALNWYLLHIAHRWIFRGGSRNDTQSPPFGLGYGRLGHSKHW